MKLVCSNDFANVRALSIKLDDPAKHPSWSKEVPNTLHIAKGTRFEIAPGVDEVKDLPNDEAQKVLALVNANKAVLDVPSTAKAIAKIDAEVAAAAKVKAKREAAVTAPASLDKVSDSIAAMIQAAVAQALKAPKPAAA
jgi:hypothetical protein